MTIKEAAKRAYNVTTEHSAEVVGSELLRKPEIMAYLNDHAQEAEITLYTVMNYSKDKGNNNPAYAGVAVTAAKDILDRVHGKPTQRIEQSSQRVNININLNSDQGLAEPQTD